MSVRAPTLASVSEHVLATNGARVVYDVHPADAPGDRPPLLMVGQPMTAGGFDALRAHFDDRLVVTYDPRGLGRSTRTDGGTENVPDVHARDLHEILDALALGPVEVFGSSGGAVAGLALVSAFPGDVRVLVAHEPPIWGALPDAAAAQRAHRDVEQAYAARGFGAGMAAFIALTSWQGEFGDDYFARPAADPAAFGLPAADDGGRDDPLLSGTSRAVTDYVLDVDALTAAPTRVVVGVAEESGDNILGRAARAVAARLGQEPVVFPSHHGGFAAAEGPYPGRPTEFAAVLRGVLDADEPGLDHTST